MMHLCVKHNQPAMMDHLWRWHRDDMVWCLEQRDSDHMTPLMLAVRLGEARMVEWLETTIVEADFARMAECGVNVVRVPCGYWHWVTFPGSKTPSGRLAVGVPVLLD